MKKLLISTCIILTALFVFCGCSAIFDDGSGVSQEYKDTYRAIIEANLDSYPLYKSLSSEKRDLYIDIATAMETHSGQSIKIGTYKTRDELRAAKSELSNLYRDICYEHPEYFWVDPYTHQTSEIEQSGSTKLALNVMYIIDKETADEYQGTFENAVGSIMLGASLCDTDFDKVLFVYDYILEHAEYDDELAENESDDTSSKLRRSAYGCLIEGKTVCSGYALAFRYIMRELGYTAGVEFNNYDNFSIITGHVWNYLELENEYYYFDLTWDDTAFDSEDYKPYLDHSHLYFGITKDELSKTNFTMDNNAPTPNCDGKKYNYYEQKGWNFEEYDANAVNSAIFEQSILGNMVELRFGSYSELLDAKSDLIDNGRINELIKDKENLRYIISNDSMHLIFFFD